VRIAYVRGPNLNAWELQNVDGLAHDVVAFASRAGRYELGDVELPVRHLPSPRDALARAPAPALAAVHRFAGNVDYLIGLERALRGFDVAHVADLSFPFSLQAVRARDAGACRRVVATVWENIAFPPWANRWEARRVERVAAGVDHCIAISEDARLHLQVRGVPDDRITVLPPGIDVERFRPAEGDGGRHEDGPLRVLCVARLVEEKGVDDLVVAAGLLRRRGVDVRVRLVGTGPLAARLPEIAQRMGVADAVEVAGPIPYAELPDAYRAADVFVLASGPRTTWREQFGFAVVEAMACGLPVVAGHSGSLAEVVGDEDQLVVPHEPALLADRLAALAADPERRHRQGERNRAWAERRYDRRAVARALAGLYEEVVERPGRGAAPG
jgi:phosphatidylinositol alpha-1,6-mannosyltransferase